MFDKNQDLKKKLALNRTRLLFDWCTRLSILSLKCL